MRKQIQKKSIFMLFLLIDEGARTCATEHIHTESKEIESKIL